MLEQRATWIRENYFDRNEIIADSHKETLRRMHGGLDPKPFYTGLYGPQRPPTPERFNLHLKVDMDSLSMEIIFSQPLPLPQYELPPRWSRATGTGLDKPGEAHAEMQQTEQRELSPFKPVSTTFCTLTA